MRLNQKALFGGIILAIVAIAAIYFIDYRQQDSLQGATVQIVMKPGAFEPVELKIKKGTRVVFKNEDESPRWPASNLHPTHQIYSEFDPREPVAPGAEWSFVFDKVGVWKFHDHLRPNLRGTITVEE